MKVIDRLRNAAHVIRRGTYLAPTSDGDRILGDLSIISTAGIAVNANSAMKLSAVFACVRKYSELPASLPMTVTKVTKGKREDLTGGTIHHLLHFPNKFMNSFSFIELMNARLQLYGNAYAVIKFDLKGDPISLIPVASDCVTVRLFNSEPFYVVNDTEMEVNGT